MKPAVAIALKITKLSDYKITKSFYAAGFVVRRLASPNARPNMNRANSTRVKIDALSENVLGASGYMSVRKASTP